MNNVPMLFLFLSLVSLIPVYFAIGAILPRLPIVKKLYLIIGNALFDISAEIERRTK